MKTSLSFLISYILVCVAGTLLCASFFMFVKELSYFIVGQTLPLFSLDFFLRGVFYSFPGVCMVTQLLLVLYIIRHPANHFFPLITYTILAIVSWAVLIPCNFKLFDAYEKVADTGSVKTVLSTDYFREDCGGVFYYSCVRDSERADGLFIDTKGYTGENSAVVPFVDAVIPENKSLEFSDVLIKNAVKTPSMISYPVHLYKAFFEKARKCWNTGILAWISFASVGLAIASLYGLQFFSSWRLLNSLLIFVAGAGVLFLNSLFYEEGRFERLSSLLSDGILAKIPLDNPLVVLLNFLIFVICLVYGIIMGLVRSKKEDSEEV